MSLRASVLLLASLAAVGTACGDDGGSDVRGGRPDDRSPGAAEVVVRIETGGGLAAASAGFAAVPELSVYGDGTVLVTGPQIEIYPPPALVNLLESHASPEALEALVEAAVDAGLATTGADYGTPSVADLPTTTITVVVDHEEHVASVYARGEDLGLSDVERDAREHLETFLRFATGEWLSEVATSGEEPYEPAAVAVFSEPSTATPPDPTDDPTDDPTVSQPAQPWPLGDLATAGAPAAGGAELRCTVVAGADAATVLDAARSANTLTPWESGGATYRVVFRPPLPDERACSDLATAA